MPRGLSEPSYDVFVNQPFFPSYATIQGAKQAYKGFFSDVGDNMPFFDKHDQRIIKETKNGTYTYTGSKSGKKGLPDWMATPNYKIEKGETQTIDLSQYTTAGHDSGSYTIASKPNGVNASISGTKKTVSLSDSFGGIGYIQFTLKDKGGDSYTRRIGIRGDKPAASSVTEFFQKNIVNVGSSSSGASSSSVASSSSSGTGISSSAGTTAIAPYGQGIYLIVVRNAKGMNSIQVRRK